MAELSPAAQAVLDAANGASSWGPDDCLNDAPQIAAAALRAAADHVVPEADANRSLCREGCVIGAAPGRIRGQLLTLITELEANQ